MWLKNNTHIVTTEVSQLPLWYTAQEPSAHLASWTASCLTHIAQYTLLCTHHTHLTPHTTLHPPHTPHHSAPTTPTLLCTHLAQHVPLATVTAPRLCTAWQMEQVQPERGGGRVASPFDFGVDSSRGGNVTWRLRPLDCLWSSLQETQGERTQWCPTGVTSHKIASKTASR